MRYVLTAFYDDPARNPYIEFHEGRAEALQEADFWIQLEAIKAVRIHKTD